MPVHQSEPVNRLPLEVCTRTIDELGKAGLTGHLFQRAGEDPGRRQAVIDAALWGTVPKVYQRFRAALQPFAGFEHWGALFGLYPDDQSLQEFVNGGLPDYMVLQVENPWNSTKPVATTHWGWVGLSHVGDIPITPYWLQEELSRRNSRGCQIEDSVGMSGTWAHRLRGGTCTLQLYVLPLEQPVLEDQDVKDVLPPGYRCLTVAETVVACMWWNVLKGHPDRAIRYYPAGVQDSGVNRGVVHGANGTILAGEVLRDMSQVRIPVAIDLAQIP